MLREFLLANGVKPKDLKKAVEEARQVTQLAHHWASFAEQALSRVKVEKAGKKVRFLVVSAKKVAGVIKQGAEGMLVPGGKIK